MNTWLLVAAGGAAGALARYGLGLLPVWPGAGWPWPTLAANLSGCLLIGCLSAALQGGASEGWRLLLGVGLLGGFTTFSAFSLETLRMIERAPLAGLAYAGVSVAGGVMLTALGWLLVRRVLA